MRLTRAKVSLPAVLLFVCSATAADPPAGGPSRSLSIGNNRVSVVYDLASGTFDVLDSLSGQTVIRNAHSELERWSSVDTNCARTGEIFSIADELGSGQGLRIRSVRPFAPVLISEFRVHGQDDSSVVLRSGLDNTTAGQLRVKEYHPLAGGIIFPGGPWSGVRSLNGDSACNQPRVTAEAFRSSANNLLLTFKQAGRRRSLVLGGLKTADFTKWAHSLPANRLDLRGVALHSSLPGASLACYLDCGVRDRSRALDGPVVCVAAGQPFTFPAGAGLERYGTIVHDGKAVIFNVTGLDPAKQYALGFSWWDFDANGRVQSVIVEGQDGQSRLLFPKRPLPQFQQRKELAAELAALIPTQAYRNGSLRLRFTNDARVPNAVVSEVWLWQIAKEGFLPAGWMEGRAVSPDCPPAEGEPPAMADLEANDPVGKLVEPGASYMPDDSFYLDCGTDDPFEALEQYGRRLRAATGANPHAYDFPTVCAWYAGVWKTPGAQNHPEKSKYRINTTAGLVEEMEKVSQSGFLRYSRVAGRLVPDTYEMLNPQGWWDDAHWRSGGYYVAPYDTSQKFGAAMHNLGTLAFTYFQPTCLGAGSLISKDFREQHTDWLCAKDVHRTLDYTHPATQEYLRKVFSAMNGAIDGLMVDYCDDLWSHEATQGGFADPHCTSTAFYRSFFKLAKTGLGPNSWLHERNLNQPNNDLTLGIVDLQRTSWDTDKISPEMVSRSGLRWYKNRVALNYDMDSKEMTSSWKVEGFTGSDLDGRRMMLTMAYVAASRLLLANSFRDLSAEALQDLARTFPYPTEPRSARPVDAFVTEGWPRVYDFAINPEWHQLTLYNNDLPTKECRFSIPLSGDVVDGALGLKAARAYYIYDFWNDSFVGRIQGCDRLEQTLRPGEARMLSLHEAKSHPQFLSTSRHLMQGYLDLDCPPSWNEATATLSVASKIVGGEVYKVVVALNGYRPLRASAGNARIALEVSVPNPGLATLKIQSPQTQTVEWQLVCQPATGNH